MIKTNLAMLATAAVMPLAYANAGTADKPKAAKPAEDAIVLTAVSTDIPIPASVARGRASKSPFNFDALTVVGASIGIVGRKGGAKSLSSIISNQNRKAENWIDKMDANGNKIMKPGEPIKDANGNVVGTQPATEAERVRVKQFRAFDVDPKTDKDGANVRIFRIEPEQPK